MKHYSICLTSVAVLLIVLLSSGAALSQDTLITDNGAELHVKVTEIADNTISYKKPENLSGSVYSVSISKVFMAIYPHGKRDVFTKNELTESSSASKVKEGKSPETSAILNDENFEVRLLDFNASPNKKDNAIDATATVDVYSSGKLFDQLAISAWQKTNVKLDYSNVNGNYFNKSGMIVSIKSDKLRNVLYQKYESLTGKGYGWALSSQFFSTNTTECTIAFLEQKSGNKEILKFGGISNKKLALKDCSTVELRILSAALDWLEVNFLNK